MQSSHVSDTVWHTPAAGGKLCEECSDAAARYCCPGCGVRTCSLPCSKAHKEASGAVGGSRGRAHGTLAAPVGPTLRQHLRRLLQRAVLALAKHAGTRASALFYQECSPASLLLA